MQLGTWSAALVGTALASAPLTAAAAGSFQPLPTSGSNILLFTTSNPNSDPLFLGDGPPAGYTQVYFNARPILRTEEGEDDAEQVGTFYDIVLRNDATQKLVFGSRVVITGEEDEDGIAIASTGGDDEEEEEEIELNHVQRLGYAGFLTKAAWARADDEDRRPDAVGMTSAFYGPGILDGSFYNSNAVTFRTDINPEELTPSSGWYLVHTDATEYRILSGAALIYGPPDEEEGRPFATEFRFDAAAPVPEPSEYAMMATGLLVMAGVLRRRRRGASAG